MLVYNWQTKCDWNNFNSKQARESQHRTLKNLVENNKQKSNLFKKHQIQLRRSNLYFLAMAETDVEQSMALMKAEATRLNGLMWVKK